VKNEAEWRAKAGWEGGGFAGVEKLSFCKKFLVKR
jgi:hypothetical protein